MSYARTGRSPLAMREVSFSPGFMKNAEGSCLVAFGETRVICTTSVTEGVPPFLKDSGQGWVTAEYEMLPRSTHDRAERRRGKPPKGRTQEIERLIGRALRQAVDLRAIPGHTLFIDCDVIGADGGTRTASVTGAWVALAHALRWMVAKGKLPKMPELKQIAAVSVGLIGGSPFVDLDYKEDSTADVDLNVVMTGARDFIEVQGTGEKAGFARKELDNLLDCAQGAIEALFPKQRDAAFK